MDKIKNFFKGLFAQIVSMDDSPQRIALGFGLGVFLGILPFTGTLAAIAAAVFLRLNKAAAVLGSLLTNTWLSLVTFAAAGKIGCQLLGYDWESIYAQAHDVFFHFTWKSFFSTASAKILLPLFLGYLIVGAFCGLAAYGAILVILRNKRPA